MTKQQNKTGKVLVEPARSPENIEDSICSGKNQGGPTANYGKDQTAVMPPKNTVPCPFLFRRGYCIKGGKSDFSHASNDHSQEGNSTCKKPKRLIPCLFLKRSGFCSKGTTCDFFHGTNRIRRPQYNHGTNRIRFPQHEQYNNMPTISP